MNRYMFSLLVVAAVGFGASACTSSEQRTAGYGVGGAAIGGLAGAAIGGNTRERLQVLQSVPQLERWLGSRRPGMVFSTAVIGISTGAFLKRLVVEHIRRRHSSMRDRGGGIMFRSIAAILALLALTVVGTIAEPVQAFSQNQTALVGTRINNGHRIRCSDGTRLLRMRGFRNVRAIDCRGSHFLYRGSVETNLRRNNPCP